MSVIAFNAVQQQAVTLIQAGALFVGQTVLKDDGKIQPEEEAALRSLGQCVVVLPILDGETLGIATGSAIIRVSVAVRFEVNPEKATLGIYDMVTSGVGAVLNYALTNKPDRFQLEDRGKTLDIYDLDPGLWAYTVFFSKACVFNRL